MKFKKIMSIVASSVIFLTYLTSVSVLAADEKSGEMRDISTMELVRDMGIGINLGNTFDACGDWIAESSAGTVSDYEKAWGSPIITKKMIQGYADEGFGVLRIPVAWSNRMVQDGNYKIDSELMSRITQIVDWTLESGMYAIVNIHWDNGWVNKFPENKNECMKRFETMWTQISDNFKDYGDHLMLESQNEELGWESVWNKWAGNDGKEESYQLVNEINQKFVDTVRKSGGNNDKRHLLISGYNTGIDVTCDPLFKMPNDPAKRCAVSVHYYTPAGFAILEEDADWGKATSTWGTDADFSELYGWMDMMKTNFIDKGIPVIIGEYGCPKKNKDEKSVRLFLSSVCKEAYERKLCPVLWDTPGNEESPAHYSRAECKLNDQQLKKAFDEITGHQSVERPTEPSTEPTTNPTTQPTTKPTTTKPTIGTPDKMRDISTMDLVKDMGIGINLGNTFDACGDWIAQWSDGTVSDYEKAWGSPIITKKMIQGYADEGFGVLRIPVAWSNRMVQDGNYKIDSEWMARITQIVDWTLESGMYAIVNIHWDNGWVNTFPENKDECMKRFETMWTQISDNFKDYGDHLMLESQNEELGWESVWNKWAGNDGKEESYQLVNEINQKFVDTVRKSGGNNDKRHLLISGYNTGIDVTCDPLFKMPDDPAKRCAVSVHYYTPAGFAILEEDADWGKATSTWGTDADFSELYGWMDMMKTNFIDKGIPVIIGEYGCPKKNKDADSVRLFLSSVCKAAYERNLCPVLWDTPGNEEASGHYDRAECKLTDQQLKQAFDEITGHKTVENDASGDVNGDGKFNVADVVLMQQWLVKYPNTTLADWKAGDLCKDNVLDVFDLCIMRRKLILILDQTDEKIGR